MRPCPLICLADKEGWNQIHEIWSTWVTLKHDIHIIFRFIPQNPDELWPFEGAKNVHLSCNAQVWTRQFSENVHRSGWIGRDTRPSEFAFRKSSDATEPSTRPVLLFEKYKAKHWLADVLHCHPSPLHLGFLEENGADHPGSQSSARKQSSGNKHGHWP